MIILVLVVGLVVSVTFIVIKSKKQPQQNYKQTQLNIVESKTQTFVWTFSNTDKTHPWYNLKDLMTNYPDRFRITADKKDKTYNIQQIYIQNQWVSGWQIQNYNEKLTSPLASKYTIIKS